MVDDVVVCFWDGWVCVFCVDYVWLKLLFFFVLVWFWCIFVCLVLVFLFVGWVFWDVDVCVVWYVFCDLWVCVDVYVVVDGDCVEYFGFCVDDDVVIDVWVVFVFFFEWVFVVFVFFEVECVECYVLIDVCLFVDSCCFIDDDVGVVVDEEVVVDGCVGVDVDVWFYFCVFGEFVGVCGCVGFVEGVGDLVDDDGLYVGVWLDDFDVVVCGGVVFVCCFYVFF